MQSGRFSLTKATRLSSRLPVLSITKASRRAGRAVQLRFLQGAASPLRHPSYSNLCRSIERKRNTEGTRGRENESENQEIPFAGVNLSSRVSVYRRGIEIVRRRESGKYRNGPTSTAFRPDVTFRFRFSSSPPRIRTFCHVFFILFHAILFHSVRSRSYFFTQFPLSLSFSRLIHEASIVSSW